MKRAIVIAALLLAFAARAQDAASWWNALAELPDVTDGLVAWWRAESNALDSVGSINGTWTGNANYVAGKSGLAFSFAGTSGDYINCGDVLDMSTNDWTVCFWINPVSSMSDYSGIVSKSFYGSAAGRWGIFFGANQNIGAVLQSGGSWASSENLGSVPVGEGWKFVMVAFDRDGYATCYINGVYSSRFDISSQGEAMDSTLPLLIGKYDLGGGDGGREFKGAIDEIRIYNRALSDSDGAMIYNRYK